MLVVRATFLVQDAFVLGDGDCKAWPDSNPDLAPIANGGRIGWLDGNDYDLVADEVAFIHSESGGGTMLPSALIWASSSSSRSVIGRPVGRPLSVAPMNTMLGRA